MKQTRKSTDLAPESAWFKSSYSSGAEGNCVEAADIAPEVGIRDSKNKAGAPLVFRRSSWTAFVASVSAGALDASA
ncbi:DUF397 domain-containing protein [Streptomyces fructofermentans]|uniref:DUF397 domain-containing protein n=1 Tax=Streptomyces fructofermentans TaxID=152141 RepID=A0A918NTK6_9ACTN|nr:DUF397 domain-containing protein [Streptomyces fructofermentans]GGX95110.1 hypothetical protein GCM10010515_72310 [Streptomyces fructofermentans]